MKNEKHEIILSEYVSITTNRFYNKDQKDVLLKLIIAANGAQEGVFSQLKRVIDLDESGVFDSLIFCNNYLLLNSHRKSEKQELLNSFVESKSDALRSLPGDSVYFNKTEWLTDVYRDKNTYSHYVDLGAFAYIKGDVAEAERRFLRLAESNDVLSVKIAAYFATKKGNAEEAHRLYSKLRFLITKLDQCGGDWIDEILENNFGNEPIDFQEEELQLFDEKSFSGDSTGFGFARNTI